MSRSTREGLRPPGPSATADWAAALDPRLRAAMAGQGVQIDQPDGATLRLAGVPLCPQFNKPRSNLLLRHAGLTPGTGAFVDADLVYHGDDPGLAAAMTGPCQRHWRRLRLPHVPGSASEALAEVLRLLGSPLARPAEEAVERAAHHGDDEQPGHDAATAGRMLSAVGEAISPEAAAAAFDRSRRRVMARRLAALTTRPAPPRAAVLWGSAGCGRDELLLAAAHPLFQSREAGRVIRVSGALVSAGCLAAPEVDAGLMHLVAEMEAVEASVWAIQDLDLCVTGSPVSFALLGRALDRGLRMLATVRGSALLRRIRADGALARRIGAIHVPPLDRRETIEVLREMADSSPVPIAPEALTLAVSLAAQTRQTLPAGALGLLSAAITEAQWQGRARVEPEDLLAVSESQWPGEEEDEDD